ncbi:MAG: DUF4255 domain-containing protein [Gallionellaceae bacterium]
MSEAIFGGMLGGMLDVVAKQLNSYIETKLGHPDHKDYVFLTNPASNTGEFFSSGNGLYLSLLNIEEELSRREGSVKRRAVGSQMLTSQPPVNINLQVIFIAHFPTQYVSELNLIYWTMAFFQQKPLFNMNNSPELADCGFSGGEKLIFELNTLPLEQMHYIWANLGMKQMPSITYKIKILTIQESTQVSDGGVIESIEMVNKG